MNGKWVPTATKTASVLALPIFCGLDREALRLSADVDWPRTAAPVLLPDDERNRQNRL
jgi:hypothetical protein